MANQAIKNQGPKPTATASVAGTTAIPENPACSICKDTKRVIFVEKERGLKSVGPCECVKA